MIRGLSFLPNIVYTDADLYYNGIWNTKSNIAEKYAEARGVGAYIHFSYPLNKGEEDALKASARAAYSLNMDTGGISLLVVGIESDYETLVHTITKK
ncbi:hypothetical protein [Bacillus solimangrovi]|uniref:Uncharacterized protein n=1 Tax=Bacillus solimangrovi TaxID=1305675 RepID=A0A1E5LJ27_9BACI|nr:hypothetical protein [Bacillus solimangrovi]OEH94099.1 hypothetical protein BFG57_09640 [Bacillus solimangrovi]